MIAGHKVLAVIIARGGSKGLPRKNVRPLAGKPLILYTIEAAKASRYIDRVVLSSEDSEIIAVAASAGCESPFVREAQLADDVTSGTDVVMDTLERVPGYEFVVLLQPTSPMRTAEDIDGCITRCVDGGATSCITVSRLAKPAEWLYRLQPDGSLASLLGVPPTGRRQDSTPVYAPNGAVYVASVSELRRTRTFMDDGTRAYEMPPERSIDIDTLHDFAVAEALLMGPSPG